MAQRRAFLSRTTLTVALALLAPLSLSACGSNTGSSGGGAGTLRVMDAYVDQPDKQVYAKVLDACGQRNGVKIEREAVPGASLISKVLQQASSRTLPDVLMLDNPDLQQIAAAGALAPLGDFGLSADGYAKGVVDASTYQGKLYGLQPVTNTIGLFYNKDMLDRAGIEPPTTWGELTSAAKKLTSGKRYGIAFSAPATREATWQFLPFMWSNGGNEKNIATPEVAQALQLWVDLVKNGSASKSVVNWGQADVNDQFKAGNAAMMINGPWQFPVLDEEKGLHYGVVQIPVRKAGGAPVVPLGGETWTVPRTGNAQRQAKAAKVVACLNSDKNQLSLAAERQTVPTKTALMDKFAAEQPRMKAFIQQVRDARARTGELGKDWPKAATRIYTAIQTALTHGATPAQALKQAQDG
ncbi:sugar ABC transporter substrate-binding protein [Streptomyces sp. RTd22]|uniref:sugar ABC transporter substrate-binding protein n=1 Tax=Streptomyces sp. RTd22 TaxID=1841249 RepID=UPI0007C5A4CF|nr:sugar ABC transporter substrate-binding protein [Streptomyces sp. RTd22]